MSSQDAFKYFMRAPVELKTITASFRESGRASVEIYDFIGTSEHYSKSFGSQWTRYRNVQIDRFNGTNASYNHLLAFVQGNLSVLDRTVCLEIGSGAGRFTDYLVDLCKTVITVDPSPALFANVALGAPNLVPCRADLFDIPVCRREVDVVFCRGVIQHTANPRRAIAKLFDYVRPGGVVLFDVYPLKWYTPFVTKYWLRPLTRQVDPERFTVWAEKWVPRLLRFKKDFVNRMLPASKVGVNFSNQIVPIADFSRSTEFHAWEQIVQWSVLDTVDMYTPRYDRPLTFGAITRVLQETGARGIQANRSTFCFKAVAP
ncbi:MAG: class I SAM-dependent methyltransferase [Deltaproteobacteria bacterium]|nr:class I SAM-dependent methyltransferase [Deltaproteobacteria bacterium]